MQAQTAYGVWEYLVLWLLTGSSFLGLPPGERDAALMRSVPPQTLAYFEWTGRADGMPSGTGIDRFVTDPEIVQFFEKLEAQNPVGSAEASQQNPPDVNAVDRPPAPSNSFQIAKLISAHPGCLFVGFEPRRADNGPAGRWLEALKGVHGGIILSCGKDQDLLWSMLMDGFSSNPDFQFETTANTQTIPISIPGYSLVVHREGDRILFALGQDTLDRMLGGLANKLPGLESNDRFVGSVEQVNVLRMSTVAWIDVRSTVNQVMTALGPMGLLVRPATALTGLDSVDHVVRVSGVENHALLERTLIRTNGKSDGMLGLFSGQPIRKAQVAHIPPDADFALAVSINLPAAYRETRKALAVTQPLSARFFDEVVKQLEKEMELSVTSDILPAFGDVVTLFDAPSASGMMVSGLIGSLEIRDRQKAEVVFERLLNHLEQAQSPRSHDGQSYPQYVRSQSQFLGRVIETFQSVESTSIDRPVINPTFCLTDKHLLFALHPQAMKGELRYLYMPTYVSGSPKVESQLADSLAQTDQTESIVHLWIQGRRTYELLGAAIPYLVPAWIDWASQHGISVRAVDFPSVAAISPYFGDATMTLRRDPKGLIIESRNMLPVTTALIGLSIHDQWKRNRQTILEASPGWNSDRVVPAAGVNPGSDARRGEPSTLRRFAPALIKSLIPEELQLSIPEEAYRRLQEGPTEEQIQRREDARQRRELIRRQRDEQRRRRFEPPSTNAPAPAPEK